MKYLHAMVRVTNVEASPPFYRDALGLEIVNQKDSGRGAMMKSFLTIFLATLIFANPLFAAEDKKDAMTDHAGFKIEKVEAGSMFGQIGLQPGDTIKKYNGKDIRNAADMAEMYSSFKTTKKVKLLIERDGQEKILHYFAK